MIALRRLKPLLPWAVALVVAGSAVSAWAYTVTSPLGLGCHEKIASESWLVSVPEVFGALSGFRLPALEPGSEAQRKREVLLRDIPFGLEHEEMRYPGGIAFLLGVRDPDLKGRSMLNGAELSEVHGNPEGQKEHCLRHPEHDGGAEGSERALTACREYIRETLVHAIREGLDPEGLPNGRETSATVFLEFFGESQVDLPVFHFYLGRSVHALQDSFTHTFRDPDRLDPDDPSPVRVVLNWADFAKNHLDERVDGPPHLSKLDDCHGDDPIRRGRAMQAKVATIELIQAVLGPDELSVKEAKIDVVLGKWMAFEYREDCKYEYNWCDAPELRFRPHAGASCSTISGGGAGALLLLLLFPFGLVLRARRWTVLGVLGLGLLLATPALADEGTPPETTPASTESEAVEAAPSEAEISCTPGQKIKCDCLEHLSGVQTCNAEGTGYGECQRCEATPLWEGARPAKKRGLGSLELPFVLASAFGISLDRTALSFGVGARYEVSRTWRMGVDIEWNPWFAGDTLRFTMGVANLYYTLIKRWPVNDWIAIQTTGQAGISALLFHTYGAKAGSLGPYLGVSFLGVIFNIGSHWRFTIDPSIVAVPIPHITGAPLVYRQYRLVFGIEYARREKLPEKLPGKWVRPD